MDGLLTLNLSASRSQVGLRSGTLPRQCMNSPVKERGGIVFRGTIEDLDYGLVIATRNWVVPAIVRECWLQENGLLVPEEKGSRMESEREYGQCFCTSRPFAHRICHCHCLVVLLPLQRLQGSAP
ncbi:unnamed protein product [Sphenostylis stenocarpa]|uniref:Uncharacterized protein n=1 Tax=Sphenostylis stenocarpa TaxID=92480 RepID=A0AA86VLX2_9FABA|nr:unnamed protein product [Sphenostylis stenocarpa]